MRIWGAGMRIALISQLCRHNPRARNRRLSASRRVKSERTIPFSREMCKFAADCVLCVRCALRRRPGPRGVHNPRPVSLISAAIARRDSPQKLNKAIQTLLCNALSISRQAQRRRIMQPHIIRRNIGPQHSQLAALDAQHSARLASVRAGPQHDSGANGDCRLIAHAPA